MIRVLATGFIGLWLLALSATASAQSADGYPLAESAGVIQELEATPAGLGHPVVGHQAVDVAVSAPRSFMNN